MEKEDGVEVIKKAYRKLALQLHPDKNKAPRSSEAFKSEFMSYSYTRTYVHTYVCVYAPMYVRTYIALLPYVCTYMNGSCAQTHVQYIRTYVRACLHTNLRMYTSLMHYRGSVHCVDLLYCICMCFVVQK